MEKIYVDEYIRTEKGISKIIDVESVEDFGGIIFKTDKNDEKFVYQGNIKNHNFNILDLIEKRRFSKWKTNSWKRIYQWLSTIWRPYRWLLCYKGILRKWYKINNNSWAIKFYWIQNKGELKWNF